MKKLNPKLRNALAVVSPYSDKTGLIPAMRSGALNMRGMSYNELLAYIEELEDIGMLKIVEAADDLSDLVLILTSEGASYFRQSKLEVLRSIGRYLFQLLLGASGGLVVWILGTLAS